MHAQSGPFFAATGTVFGFAPMHSQSGPCVLPMHAQSGPFQNFFNHAAFSLSFWKVCTNSAFSSPAVFGFAPMHSQSGPCVLPMHSQSGPFQNFLNHAAFSLSFWKVCTNSAFSSPSLCAATTASKKTSKKDSHHFSPLSGV